MRLTLLCSFVLLSALSSFAAPAADPQPTPATAVQAPEQVAPSPAPAPQQASATTASPEGTAAAPQETTPTPSPAATNEPQAPPPAPPAAEEPAIPATPSASPAPPQNEPAAPPASPPATGNANATGNAGKKVEPAPAAAEQSAKKNGKTAQRPKNGVRSFPPGPGNNIPLFIAGLADDTETARQLATFWAEPFAFLRTPRPATAAPPLLVGIRSQQPAPAKEEQEEQITIESALAKKLAQQEEVRKISDTIGMLHSLIELQKNLKQQIATLSKKIKTSTSESEKQALQEELVKLDKQLTESNGDFEHLATGVEPEVFAEKQPVTFSWKDEMAALLEPSIKELKQLTARTRQKSELKENIADYNNQVATARRAIDNINRLIAETGDPKIKQYLGELLPAWQSLEKRIASKLDLAQRNLAKLEDKDVSLLKSSSASIRDFFHERGLYLLIAFAAFIVILLAFRLIARLLFFVLPGARREQRPTHVRILDIFFQMFSVASAIFGMIFVLYTAEDWFLLSATIIVFCGLAWTVRQALPKMWQQMRLMLNMGSIREGERVIYANVPWKVESLNVFCKLYNPALGMHLRLPIENMIGLISRPYNQDEPWFPCQKGDWVAIDGKPFAKVVSLSHEQVEVVELGGRRTIYPTGDFLGMSPANLSSNFNMRVVFGLSYDLQGIITTTVLTTLQSFLKNRMAGENWAEDCLSLSVDFLQAGASSLDVAVLLDLRGKQAPAYRRIERAINRWCVECCNENNWEIPFPQMTLHLPYANTK